MENNYKNFIKISDLKDFLSKFSEDTKVFFFEVDENDMVIGNATTTLNEFDDFTYVIEENGEPKQEKEEKILAFCFYPKEI